MRALRPSVLFALLLMGCAGRSTSLTSAPPAAAKSAAAPTSPIDTIWDFHPKTPASRRARLDLAHDQRLRVGGDGERWLVDLRAGTARAAPLLADEDLVSISRAADGSFVFVGERGSIFVAASPLGAFTSVRQPDPNIVRVQGAGNVLVGIRSDGKVAKSADGGKTFVPVQLQSERLVDVAIAADGRVLLLGAPEQLWQSADGGGSFARVGAGGIGLMDIGLDAAGNPVARGLLKTMEWTDRTNPQLQPLQGRYEPTPMDLLAEPVRGANGASLLEGSATLVGMRYFEAVAPEKPEDLWQLATGNLVGPLRLDRIGPSQGCSKARVSAWGNRIAIACLSGSRRSESPEPRSQASMPSVRLLFSHQAGVTFESKPTGLLADELAARVLVLASGTVLLSGMCRTTGHRLCEPNAIWRAAVNPEPPLRIEAVTNSEMPALSGRVGAPVVSPDGKRVYAPARLAANRAFAVLISDDDGASFRAVKFDFKATALGAEKDSELLLRSLQFGEMRIDAAGTLSLILLTSRGQAWTVFDRDAHLLSARLMDGKRAYLAAVGTHALAFSDSDDDDPLEQSDDGGATFQKVAQLRPGTLTHEAHPTVGCGASGCAMGEEFSRQGWGRAAAGLVDREHPTALNKPKTNYLSTIVCRTSDDHPSAIQGDVQFPSLHHADLGPTAWSITVTDRSHAAVSVVSGFKSPKPHTDTQVLLAPASIDYAFSVVSQAEGMAALRYPIERDAYGNGRTGAPMRNVEVAWLNQLDRPAKHAKIADAGTLRAGDLYASRSAPGNATPALLSVSLEGMFVCPHASCDGSDREAIYIDSRGAQHPVRMPTWPKFMLPGDQAARIRSDMISVDGQAIPLAFVQDKMALARARPGDGGGFRFEAMTFLPLALQQKGYGVTFSWAFSQSSRVVSLAITVAHATEPTAFARMLQFHGNDAGVATLVGAPVQSKLGDPPRVCTDSHRKGTFRVVGPVEGGARHPVRIDTSPKNSTWLVTDEAILYGTDQEPCVSVYGTEQVPSITSRYRALIDVSDMRHSWLFERGSAAELTWRTLECRFDPSVKLPGTLRRESNEPEAEPEPPRDEE